MSDQHDSTPPADDWQVDWEGNRRQQLLQTLRATPGQRLRWLEEMIQFAYRTGALPKRGDRTRE
jgi:hypothetical protein